MNHRRTGKIARLPEEIRNHVNELITDGVDYQHIIDYLTQAGFPDFSPQNLSRWKEGGYEDWLQHRSRIEELEFKTAFAVELAQSSDSSKFQQATLNLTAIQFFELLNRFEPIHLTKALEERPEKFPTVINSLAKLTREVIGLERFRADQAERAKRDAERSPHNLGGLRDETIEKMLMALRIRYPDAFKAAAETTLSAPEAGDHAKSHQITPNHAPQ
jgi:hypothetical protein